MKVNKFVRAIIIIVILAFNIGCDQVSKTIVRKDLPDNKVIGYLGNHFTLEKTENTGAFLSLGDSLGGVGGLVEQAQKPVEADRGAEKGRIILTHGYNLLKR